MTKPMIDRRTFTKRTSLALGATSLASMFGGCTPEQVQQKSASAADGSEARVSTVPLRISLVAPLAQPDTVIRQWRAISDQPIEISSITADQLVSSDKCAADLLLYPARLIGELVGRQWIVKLPAKLAELTKPDVGKRDDENLFATIPPAMVVAGMYGSVIYGLPVGYSMISLLGSATNEMERLSWTQLESALAKYEVRPLEFEDSQVDRDALVDRFLALAIGRSDVNGKYGVLFDIRTMKPRLSAAEFSFAAEILLRLACQPNALRSIIGSHSEAWQWINGSADSVFALACASQIDVESATMDSAKLISMEDSKPWNSGSGILASIATNCRQSAQSMKFAYWLAQSKTLDTIRGLSPGLISAATRGRSLAERVIASNSMTLQQDTIVCEPRAAGAQQLRDELASHLVELIRGKISVEDALSTTANRWNLIVKQSSSNPKADYERSLGLRDN